jgi:hypothetical protein
VADEAAIYIKFDKELLDRASFDEVVNPASETVEAYG